MFDIDLFCMGIILVSECMSFTIGICVVPCVSSSGDRGQKFESVNAKSHSVNSISSNDHVNSDSSMHNEHAIRHTCTTRFGGVCYESVGPNDLERLSGQVPIWNGKLLYLFSTLTDSLDGPHRLPLIGF